MRILLALSLIAGFAEDVVKLRNGRHITGTVVIDESDPNGFRIILRDTGGTVYIRKDQVPEQEWYRLRVRPQEVQGEQLEGIRILTTSDREHVGILVNAQGAPLPFPTDKEQFETTIRVKTKDSPSPVSIPKVVVKIFEPVKLRESEAYTPSEMVDRRLKAADPAGAAKLLEIAEFAKSLKLYDRAKEIYLQAAAADPARKAEIDEKIAELDGLVREAQAETKLAEITKLAEGGKFDEAVAAAEEFLKEFAETKAGKKNADLVQRLQKEREDYAKNRADFLAKKVPEAWRSQRASLLSEYAKSKYKVAEARQLLLRMDDEILDKLSKKFNCPPEDVARAWEKREKKPRTVDMGTGSWIYKGGQDGGYDYESGGGGMGGDDPVDDFARRFGGGQKKKNDAPKQETGVKLDTSDKWWSDAGQSKRQDWLETEYALTSKYVKKEKEEEKKCTRCQGKGTLKATREGKQVDVICPVCHKTAVIVTVTYW